MGTGRRFAEGVAEQLVDDLLKIRVRSRSSEFDGTKTGELVIQDIDPDGEVRGEFRSPYEDAGPESSEVVTMMAEYVEPVQLQVVCQTLWEGLRPDETEITAEHLKTCGDANRALSAFYERCVYDVAQCHGLREGEVRRWFDGWLITQAGTRGTVFRGPSRTGGLLNEAVDMIEEMHLIHSENRGGGQWCELTHDRFIEPIRQSNRCWRGRHSEYTLLALEHRANEWWASRDPAKLLAESELIQAETWIAGPDASEIGYSDRLADYLHESRVALDMARARAQAEEAERRKTEENTRKIRRLQLRARACRIRAD